MKEKGHKAVSEPGLHLPKESAQTEPCSCLLKDGVTWEGSRLNPLPQNPHLGSGEPGLKPRFQTELLALKNSWGHRRKSGVIARGWERGQAPRQGLPVAEPHPQLPSPS